MIVLDAVDRNILNLLQADGRMTNADLAERIHLSPSACLRRVRRLEDAGVIERYAMIVNEAAVGRTCNVFLEVTLNSLTEEALAEFEAAVMESPDVMACYLMSGDADYLLHVVVADTADYERVHKLVARLPGLARTRSSFVLRNVCRRSTFPF
ncbi:MAG: Lrp/AsnC family transcriptional regulator [Rhodospirillaceae bacterium]|nr:Lrp/AsnC family transcriptional regulator [Rhodospirillaceae bacterium]